MTKPLAGSFQAYRLQRTKEKARDRLEYLRGEIVAERISQDEILELQDLKRFIDPSDNLLLQWAGVPEEKK